MSAEGRPAAGSARSFLALELPPAVRARLGRLQQQLRRRNDGWRWVRPDNIHLTLRFLGDVDAEQDRRSRPAWSAAAAGVGAIRIRIGALGCFGRGRNPRVLWVSAHEAAGRDWLVRLARRIERAAVAEGFAPARRPFRPHLTLARAQRDARASMPGDGFVSVDTAFDVDALGLFRSETLPGGARYTVLERFSFGRCTAGPAARERGGDDGLDDRPDDPARGT